MSIWFPKINIICNEERKWHETSMIFAFQVWTNLVPMFYMVSEPLW
jgi:hypothetical protein